MNLNKNQSNNWGTISILDTIINCLFIYKNRKGKKKYWNPKGDRRVGSVSPNDTERPPTLAFVSLHEITLARQPFDPSKPKAHRKQPRRTLVNGADPTDEAAEERKKERNREVFARDRSLVRFLSWDGLTLSSVSWMRSSMVCVVCFERNVVVFRYDGSGKRERTRERERENEIVCV